MGDETPHPEETVDERIRARILAELALDIRISDAGLRVGVLNGIAHLAGSLDLLYLRSAAEQIAKKVPGVRGVVNRIEAPGAPPPARIIQLDMDDIRLGLEQRR